MVNQFRHILTKNKKTIKQYKKIANFEPTYDVSKVITIKRVALLINITA